MTRQRLILFSKRPSPGRVKTRLAERLGAQEALALHRAFLRDSLGLLRSLAGPERSVEWRLDRPWTPDADLAAAAAGIERRVQGPGDLGARLLRAFRDSAAGGHDATIVIGSDSPTLPPQRITAAFDALASGARAVVAPSRDGGYVLIGMRRPVPELFQGVPWGAAEVLESTRVRAAEARIELAEVRGWYDVDRLRDLELLEGDLRDPATAARAPATARYLASRRRRDTPDITDL